MAESLAFACELFSGARARAGASSGSLHRGRFPLSSSSSSAFSPFSQLSLPARKLRPPPSALSTSAKPPILKGPFFSEGRDADEHRLICPDCGIFMQELCDLSSDSDGFLEEEKEEEVDREGGIKGLSSKWDSEFDIDDSSNVVSVEGAIEEEVAGKGVDWDSEWEDDDEEENLRKELDGFAPAGVGYGNITEETLEKMKEKVSKSEKKQRIKEKQKTVLSLEKQKIS